MIQGFANIWSRLKKLLFRMEDTTDDILDQLPKDITVEEYLDTQPDCSHADLW